MDKSDWNLNIVTDLSAEIFKLLIASDFAARIFRSMHSFSMLLKVFVAKIENFCKSISKLNIKHFPFRKFAIEFSPLWPLFALKSLLIRHLIEFCVIWKYQSTLCITHLILLCCFQTSTKSVTTFFACFALILFGKLWAGKIDCDI